MADLDILINGSFNNSNLILESINTNISNKIIKEKQENKNPVQIFDVSYLGTNVSVSRFQDPQRLLARNFQTSIIIEKNNEPYILIGEGILASPDETFPNPEGVPFRRSKPNAGSGDTLSFQLWNLISGEYKRFSLKGMPIFPRDNNKNILQGYSYTGSTFIYYNNKVYFCLNIEGKPHINEPLTPDQRAFAGSINNTSNPEAGFFDSITNEIYTFDLNDIFNTQDNGIVEAKLLFRDENPKTVGWAGLNAIVDNDKLVVLGNIITPSVRLLVFDLLKNKPESFHEIPNRRSFGQIFYNGNVYFPSIVDEVFTGETIDFTRMGMFVYNIENKSFQKIPGPFRLPVFSYVYKDKAFYYDPLSFDGIIREEIYSLPEFELINDHPWKKIIKTVIEDITQDVDALHMFSSSDLNPENFELQEYKDVIPEPLTATIAFDNSGTVHVLFPDATYLSFKL